MQTVRRLGGFLMMALDFESGTESLPLVVIEQNCIRDGLRGKWWVIYRQGKT